MSQAEQSNSTYLSKNNTRLVLSPLSGCRKSAKNDFTLLYVICPHTTTYLKGKFFVTYIYHVHTYLGVIKYLK